MRVIADAVYDLDAVRRRWAKRLKLACNGNADARTLAEILAPFRAEGLPVTILYANDAVAGEVDLADSWRVTPDGALIERLREWLEPANVALVY